MSSEKAASLQLFERLSQHFSFDEPFYYNYAVIPTIDESQSIFIRRDALSKQRLMLEMRKNDSCTACSLLKKDYFDKEIPCVDKPGGQVVAGVRCERQIVENSPAFLYRTLQPLIDSISSDPSARVYVVQQATQADTEIKNFAIVTEQLNLNAALKDKNIENNLSAVPLADRTSALPIWQIVLIGFFAIVLFLVALSVAFEVTMRYKRKQSFKKQRTTNSSGEQNFTKNELLKL